jgi:hypothetical protein
MICWTTYSVCKIAGMTVSCAVMSGHSVNTFKLLNKAGKETLVKVSESVRGDVAMVQLLHACLASAGIRQHPYKPAMRAVPPVPQGWNEVHDGRASSGSGREEHASQVRCLSGSCARFKSCLPFC